MKDKPQAREPLRVAFFFIGMDRMEMMKAVQEGTMPDSMLRGANFFTADKTFAVDTISSYGFESHLPRIVKKLIPMSLLQLVFVPRLLTYDVVIASDAFLLGYAVSLLGRLPGRRTHTKWVFVAINSSVLIRRHATHTVRRWLLRLSWSSYAAIACLSDRQRLDLIDFGLKEEDISTIHFGVDTSYYRPFSDKEGEIVMSIGKDYGRDYETLLSAAGRSGLPMEIITSHKNIPPGTSIPKNVRVVYDVPLDKLRDSYERARMVVFAVHPDDTIVGGDCCGQTVLLEALAMRRPVISTSRAWLTEYLTEGSDYIEVPSGDAEALAQALRKLWDDASLRRRLAAHGQHAVRESYSSRRFAADLASLVKRVAA